MTPGQNVVRWQRRTKLRALTYKGGCCCLCGYSKSVRSLHFHHMDINGKDFGIGSAVRAWEKTRVELDKCVLLCSNCHGEVHEGITKVTALGPTPAEGLVLIQQAGLTALVHPRGLRLCPSCGKRIHWDSQKCLSCVGFQQKTKILWPSPETLAQMVASTPVHQIAKRLGVSDQAVTKRMRNHPVTH